MQLAILIVLVLILLVLAPWLIGVIAVLAAAYGVWLVAAFVISIVVGVVCVLIYALGTSFSKPRAVSSSTEAKIAEANRAYREKEAARRELERQEQLKYDEIIERTKASRLIACKSCHASIEKHGPYCPVCGKSTA